jgi:hypothetical protein
MIMQLATLLRQTKAGKPYKIEAVYEEEIEGNKVRIDDVLYMFTLKNNTLGTIYLNNFSPNPCKCLYPTKPIYLK